MKTRRPIAINNSLAHGICNYNCQLCGVNKKSYRGPKEFQPRAVTEALIDRIVEAARQGLRIRYVANAGDGEPTLHPEFGERMDMFGAMIRAWDVPAMPPPEVSVVTNGARLAQPGILDAFVRNPLTLIVSFPTADPEAYGQVVSGDPRRGRALFRQVEPGIRQALALCGQGKIRDVQFHVSPPDREVIRRDFDRTVGVLTGWARNAGLDRAHLVLFPVAANRSGLIRHAVRGCDMYPDLFRRYDGRRLNGVRVSLSLSYRRFFPKMRDLFDLMRSFDYPCTWNSQLFITARGDSICCNDQAVRQPLGNLTTSALVELVENKERYRPGKTCAGCDQTPDKMALLPVTSLFGLVGRLAKMKYAWVRARQRSRRVAEGEDWMPPLYDGSGRGH